ncbi:MAG: phospholipase [Anaerolineae bacterium]|nr:phospholipase [Anaerolineae bacterium]
MTQKPSPRETASPTTSSTSDQKPGCLRILQIVGTALAALALAIAGLLAGGLGIDVSGRTSEPTATVQPLPTDAVLVPGRGVTEITLPQGFGAQKGFWSVYFTAPTGDSRTSTYHDGIETQLIAAVNSAQRTIDIAAYEFNLVDLTQALLAARQRGVQVRVVTDDDAGFDAPTGTLRQLVEARIPVVIDGRRALMHNKFVIIDSLTVWMGSWNFTVNGTYRNNNNVLVLRSQAAVQNYQAEFDEMFNTRLFGPSSPSRTPRPDFRQDGIPILTYFAPEDDVLDAILATVNSAQHSIKFMTFSFTVDPIGQAMIARAGQGVNVQGIFETTGSETQFSELPILFCAGLDARQDGNPYRLHHKVFIIDDETVMTGSFNISQNAVQSNDENLVIITDRDLAAEYLAEFDRRWAESRLPQGIVCN